MSDQNRFPCGSGVRIALAVAISFALSATATAQGQRLALQAPALEEAQPDSSHQTELSNAVPVEDLAAPVDGELGFFIDVPAGSGHLIIETSGGTGDADIYVGHEFEPDLVDFDCVGWLDGNDERCWFPIPEAGRYNILLHAYEAIAGVRLEARFSDEQPEVRPLANGQPVAVGAVPAGTMSFFAFVVEEGSTDLVVDMSGGPATAGEAELYVRFGEPPVQDEFYWDCRPWIDGNDETCTFENPEPGLWYAGVEAWPALGEVDDVNLVATWNAPATDVPGNLQVAWTGARMRPVHQLGWNGGGAEIDVWMNDTLVHHGVNSGSYSQPMLLWQLPCTWRVCNAGTSECSADVPMR